MGDERDIADITLQLLAKAGEITVKEQQKRMPSTALASRLRTGNNGPPVSGGAPGPASSHHYSTPTPQHDHRNVLDGAPTQRQAPRGRQKELAETQTGAATPIAHAHERNDVFRGAPLPPQPAPTEVMRLLEPLPVRRAWTGRTDEGLTEALRLPVAEAIMLHEKGEVQTLDQRCSKCRRGEGMSPECVKITGIHNGACSNCLMARALSHPAPAPAPAPAIRPLRSYSAERRSISATMPTTIPKEDLIAVWNLIAGVISTQPQECFFEEGTETPGKRIEDAARLVARSADEWGHTIQEEGPDSGKTPSERSRLVRQATRIRETALKIASCARDWGEKLEKKRSSSRLRS